METNDARYFRVVAGDQANEDEAAVKLMPLHEIKPRPGPSARSLNSRHVEALAWSIRALGLLEPLVVDRFGYLLAGGHRLAAIQQLHELGEWTEPVPVRILTELEVHRNPRQALLIELAENDKRRDYTKEEIRELAERLRLAGFCHNPGRPRANEPRLLPALEAAVGKSRRRLQQILNESRPKKVQDCMVSVLRRLDRASEKALASCERRETTEIKALARDLRRIRRRIERLLDRS